MGYISIAGSKGLVTHDNTNFAFKPGSRDNDISRELTVTIRVYPERTAYTVRGTVANVRV